MIAKKKHSGGGSNYVSSTLGLDHPIIGTYHLDPDVVKTQIQDMFNHGQRKISFTIWYTSVAPGASTGVAPDVWLNAVNSNGGALTPQHKQNLADILRLVRDIGFQEIIIRFGPLGVSSPDNVTPLTPELLQEDLDFTMSTIEAVEGMGLGVPIIYDLAAEGPNVGSPGHMILCQELWKAYVDRFDINKSCAFSIPISFKSQVANMQLMIDWIRGTGLPLPIRWHIDTYDNPYASLLACHNLLRQLHLPGLLVVQECFYNDPITASQIKKDQALFNINGIYQWPLERGSNIPNQSVIYTPLFNNYINL